MANNDGGKGNFGGTGGYTSGGTVAGNAGGYGNPSSPTGGTGGQTQNSYNSGNWGGGFSGMGYANDKANAQQLAAALARAMDKGAGGALLNQPGIAPKPPVPKPPVIAQPPVPAPPAPQSPFPPVPGDVVPEPSYARPIDYSGSAQPGWSPGTGYPGRPGADGLVSRGISGMVNGSGTVQGGMFGGRR